MWVFSFIIFSGSVATTKRNELLFEVWMHEKPILNIAWIVVVTFLFGGVGASKMGWLTKKI
jgi:hypothetical protein